MLTPKDKIYTLSNPLPSDLDKGYINEDVRADLAWRIVSVAVNTNNAVYKAAKKALLDYLSHGVRETE